jgi:beta-glucosidase
MTNKAKYAPIAVATLALAVVAAGASRGGGEEKPLYLDPAQPIERRVDDLVGRMTLEEKASQMANHMRAVPRLGIPEYNVWSEALHGVANNGVATVFPQAIGLAATFDPALIHDMAVATATEGRAKFNVAERAGRSGRLFQGLTFFSPNINIVRDPRWGRGQETYGEDPFLTGRMAVAFITGLQGDDPHYLRAAATAKHYTVHSGPEPLRHGFDAVVTRHDEEDTYLPAFRDAVVDGHVQIVMCVYNAINGVPGCADEYLLQGTLRDQWKFDGFVTGDCDAVQDIQRGHKYVETEAEAAAIAVKAGTDSDCIVTFGQQRPGAGPEYQKYLDAVHQGLLKESELDVAVKRVLRARFRLGLFDPPDRVPYAATPDSVVDSDEHRALALEIARKTMVLLKNDGTLPLPESTRKIAVVGPLADETRVLLGNYNGWPSHAVTALAGIEKVFSKARVVFEPGTTFLRPEQPVPASALSREGGQPGLTAEVFSGADFAGTPVETRVDAQVAAGPAPGEGFSFGSFKPAGITRWTGRLTPPATGTYTLGVQGFRNRLHLDGKLVVDTTGPYPRGPSTTEIALEKGRSYALEVEALGRPAPMARLVWKLPAPDALPRAVAAARKADVVVAVVGITSELEGEESSVDIPGFKGGDRTRLVLPQAEEELLEAVGKAGKPLVVVLMSGSALAVNWANEHAAAVLQAWYPGEEGGTAIAETLAGRNNPAGRLPVTFYKSVDQLPAFTDYSMANRTYRYFTGQPLYPFGYGLSYSRFEYGDLQLSAPALEAGEDLTARVEVKNTSARAGDEVVQAYLTFPKVPGAPLRALRGFERVHLEAGEARTVSFTLSPRDLSHVDEAGTHVVGPGTYRLSVGGGQPGTTEAVASAEFEVRGEKRLPR